MVMASPVRKKISNIVRRLPPEKLDRVLLFLENMAEDELIIDQQGKALSAKMSEKVLAKDWLTPEEDKAWENL